MTLKMVHHFITSTPIYDYKITLWKISRLYGSNIKYVRYDMHVNASPKHVLGNHATRTGTSINIIKRR